MTVKLVVLYPPAADQDGFDQHYLGVHMPLADKIPGLQRNETAVFSAAPDGQELPFRRITELYFADQAAIDAAFASPEGQATAADFAAIAPPGARMMIANVD